MKKYLYILFFLGFLVECITFVNIYKSKKESKILGGTVEIIITPTPSLAPTLKPTQKPTREPVFIPTAVSTTTPQSEFSSEEINGFIDSFAGQYGVDPNVLRHLAICESGFRQDAINLSYHGLYQFGPTTWENLRIKMGENTDISLRLNAREAIKTAAYVLSTGETHIWPNCTS